METPSPFPVLQSFYHISELTPQASRVIRAQYGDENVYPEEEETKEEEPSESKNACEPSDKSGE